MKATPDHSSSGTRKLLSLGSWLRVLSRCQVEAAINGRLSIAVVGRVGRSSATSDGSDLHFPPPLALKSDSISFCSQSHNHHSDTSHPHPIRQETTSQLAIMVSPRTSV